MIIRKLEDLPKKIINKWRSISKHYKLSGDFIRDHQDKVDWGFISTYQKLSEDFVREFQNKVDWTYISTYQNLSENFIKNTKIK